MSRDPHGQLVEKEFLTLPVWDQFDAGMAGAVARAVERCLPEPWAFTRVARHECGDQKRHVAFFDWKESEFALIPGGEMTLGWDRAKPPHLSPAHATDWKRCEEQDGFPSLAAELDRTLTCLRVVRIDPFLIQTRSATWEPERDNERAEAEAPFLRGLVEALASGGFRVPTGDEWEHACAAGSRTLWRWGDDCPSDQFPVNPPPSVNPWSVHRQANGFGLQIATDPYAVEVVDAGRAFRGGDGGCAVCGGYNWFDGWLPLASSYSVDEELVDAIRSCGDPPLYRRVYPLPTAALG